MCTGSGDAIYILLPALFYGSEPSLKWQNQLPITTEDSFSLASMGICTFSLAMEDEQGILLESLGTHRTSKWHFSFSGCYWPERILMHSHYSNRDLFDNIKPYIKKSSSTFFITLLLVQFNTMIIRCSRLRGKYSSRVKNSSARNCLLYLKKKQVQIIDMVSWSVATKDQKTSKTNLAHKICS